MTPPPTHRTLPTNSVVNKSEVVSLYIPRRCIQSTEKQRMGFRRRITLNSIKAATVLVVYFNAPKLDGLFILHCSPTRNFEFLLKSHIVTGGRRPDCQRGIAYCGTVATSGIIFPERYPLFILTKFFLKMFRTYWSIFFSKFDETLSRRPSRRPSVRNLQTTSTLDYPKSEHLKIAS